MDEYLHSRWLLVSGGGINFPGGINYGDSKGGLFGNRHAQYKWATGPNWGLWVMYLDDTNMYRHGDQPAWGYASGGVKYDVGTVSVGSLNWHYHWPDTERYHAYLISGPWYANGSPVTLCGIWYCLYPNHDDAMNTGSSVLTTVYLKIHLHLGIYLSEVIYSYAV